MEGVNIYNSINNVCSVIVTLGLFLSFFFSREARVVIRPHIERIYSEPFLPSKYVNNVISSVAMQQLGSAEFAYFTTPLLPGNEF